jgi:hypothetical protein
MINFTTSILGKRGVPFALAMTVFLAVTIPAGILRPLWYDELASRWFGEAASLGDFVNNIRPFIFAAGGSGPSDFHQWSAMASV